MSRNPLAAVCVVLLLAPLAGCMENSSGGAQIEEEAPPARADVPIWSAGDRWTYETTKERDDRTFTETYEVVGIGVVNGTPAYRVAWTGEAPGEPEEEQTRYFEVETLREVGGCGPRDPPQRCGAHIPLFDFPLEDGKTWTWVPPAPPPGSDPYQVNATAYLDDETAETWMIVHVVGDDGPEGPTWVTVEYSPSTGFMDAFVIQDATTRDVRQQTRLVDHHRA